MEGGSSAPFKVLIVDDDSRYRSSLQRFLQPDGYVILEAGGGEESLALLSRERVDAALVDVRMPGMGGLDLLARIRASAPGLPVIMLTAFGELAAAVQAMRAGATDFLEKTTAMETVRARLAQARRIRDLERDNAILRSQARQSFDFPPLRGDCPSMLRLKEAITQVGPSEASVLIEGETGTGKELVARALHHHSRRRAGPFVAVDCASLSETLVESELFGHVKGAYTGAHEDGEGLVRSAEGGTLFLDELGEIPPSMQVKLLRVMQEREVRPVGGTRSRHVDIRVIAATNRSLAARMPSGDFREDLYYRIAVVTLEVPPLRERGEDIGLLAREFLERMGGSPPVGMDADAMDRLRRHAWPGNVRELENVIHRAVVMHHGQTVTVADLPAGLHGLSVPAVGREGPAPAPAAAPAGPASTPTAAAPASAARDLASVEKAAIADALAQCGGSRRRTARMLGIGEATLYRKLRVYGLG